MEKIIELRKKLHRIPERSMCERKTKETLLHFMKENTSNLQIVDSGAWFYAWKKGEGKEEPILFRADYDAVLCEDGCPRHLCGHDGHSAILAGFALWLDRNSVGRDVYLLFQPGEETGEGAKCCVNLVEEKKISEVYGIHNIPGYEQGAVLLLKDTFACASTGLEIMLQGRESHAAYPENGINPALAMADLIQTMNSLMNEKRDGILLGTVIGMEAGSQSFGVSAGKGVLRLTLRAETQRDFDWFVERIEETARCLAEEKRLQVSIRRMEEFPATRNDENCMKKVEQAAHTLGLKVIIPKEPFRWSEDFGYYLQKTKGAFIGIGIGEKKAGLHTMEYSFEDGIIETVIRLYQQLAGRE